MTELASSGMSTNGPLMNITNNHGAQIPENCDTALKPYMATNTTIIPTARTTMTNHAFVGYQFNCAGISSAKRTAVAETVIIAAEITVKIMTFAQLYNRVIEFPAIF